MPDHAAGAKVLDVPCGEGRMSLELAARGFRVSGIDIAQPLVDDANRKAASRGLHADFEQMDMRDIPWEGEFDALLCWWGSFGYFDDAGNLNFAKAAASALKPGGRLVLQSVPYERLAASPGIEFVGNVEGRDLLTGAADVIVTDGFTGNVALKTAEGTAKLINEYLRHTFRSSLLAGLGYILARPAMKKLRERVDPRGYNGAMFLGLNGIAVKSHGGTDALGFANAIGVAVDMHRHGIIEKIRSDLSLLDRNPGNAQAAVV